MGQFVYPVGAILAIACVFQPVAAEAKAKANPKSTIQASAPRQIVNPYRNALQCLSTQLTPEQKATSIGVIYFGERTGKEAYAPEGASGKFLSQGSEDILMNDLMDTGMKAVEMGPAFRNVLDWTVPKLKAGGVSAMVTLPDIVVQGSFSTLDFGSSNVKELYVMGIGGGTRGYSIHYTMDMRATAMPGGKLPGGEVLAKLSLEKEVIGREKRAGVAGFFGPTNSSTFIEFNLNTQKRELLQYSQRYMISRAAFGIVSNLWKISNCDEQLKFGDRLVSGEMG